MPRSSCHRKWYHLSFCLSHSTNTTLLLVRLIDPLLKLYFWIVSPQGNVHTPNCGYPKKQKACFQAETMMSIVFAAVTLERRSHFLSTAVCPFTTYFQRE
jgi:hypothetical protein